MDFNICYKISELMYKHTAHKYTRDWRKCLGRPQRTSRRHMPTGFTTVSCDPMQGFS